MITSGTGSFVLWFLMIWAITGYTIIHAGVLAWRYARSIARKLPAPPSFPAGVRPTLGIVVPAFNEAMTIAATLESLLEQSERPERIVVVDDKSTDETLQVLMLFDCKGVIVVKQPENGGKARAVEAGIRVLDTDLVMMTDADSIVDRDYVKCIKEPFADPEVVATCGHVESIPHTWVTAARQVEYMIYLDFDRAAQDEMGAIFVLPGVSTTYRRDVLLRYGFEHDTIGEDLDLTFRLHGDRAKFVTCRSAKVYTSDPPTFAAYKKQLHRWNTDLWLCAKKHKRLFGKGTFGVVELPLTVVNGICSSILFLTLPFYLFAFNRPALLHYFLVGTAIDVVFILVTSVVYRRLDVWWTLLSRYPTRVIARYVYLKTLVQVILGKHDMRWNKLDRRSINRALAASRDRGS